MLQIYLAVQKRNIFAIFIWMVVMIDRTEGEEGIYRGLLSGEIKAERDFVIRKVILSYSNLTKDVVETSLV